jgi:hypothetical protein
MSRDEASLLDINHAGQQVLLFAMDFCQEDLKKITCECLQFSTKF